MRLVSATAIRHKQPEDRVDRTHKETNGGGHELGFSNCPQQIRTAKDQEYATDMSRCIGGKSITKFYPCGFTLVIGLDRGTTFEYR